MRGHVRSKLLRNHRGEIQNSKGKRKKVRFRIPVRANPKLGPFPAPGVDLDQEVVLTVSGLLVGNVLVSLLFILKKTTKEKAHRRDLVHKVFFFLGRSKRCAVFVARLFLFVFI